MPLFTTIELREALNLIPYWFQTARISVGHIKTLRFNFGDHPKQYFILMMPEKEIAIKDKLILYYHGGGWRAGSPELFKANAKVFLEKGYPVIMPSYRRAPKYKYQAIREDLSACLQKVLEILPKFSLAEHKIVLGGMSAGGNLVALLGYDRARLAAIGLSQKMFAGIFLCGAPLDLNGMRDSFPLLDFTGKRKAPMFQQANPINYLQPNEHFPVLFIHGTKDGFVPFDSAYNFIEKFKVNNAALLTEFIINEGSHLDAGSWVYLDQELRKSILSWLQKLD